MCRPARGGDAADVDAERAADGSRGRHEALPVSVILRLFLVAVHARATRVVELLYRALCVHHAVCSEAHEMATRALALAALQCGSVRPLRGLVSVGSHEEYVVECVLREESGAPAMTESIDSNNNSNSNSSSNSSHRRDIVLLQFYIMMRRYDAALQLGTRMTAMFGGPTRGYDDPLHTAHVNEEEEEMSGAMSRRRVVDRAAPAAGVQEEGSVVQWIVAHLRTLQPAKLDSSLSQPALRLPSAASWTRAGYDAGDAGYGDASTAGALAMDTSAVLAQLEAVHRSCHPSTSAAANTWPHHHQQHHHPHNYRHHDHRHMHHDKYYVASRSNEPPRPSAISTSLGNGIPTRALSDDYGAWPTARSSWVEGGGVDGTSPPNLSVTGEMMNEE